VTPRITLGVLSTIAVLAMASGVCEPARAASSRHSTPIVLSIHLEPTRVLLGRTVTLLGRLTGPTGPIGGQTIELQEAHTHGVFSDIAHTVTRADGSYRFGRVRPEDTARYRVRPVTLSGILSQSVTLTVDIPVPLFPASSAVVAAARYLAGRAGFKSFAVLDNKGKLSGTDIHDPSSRCSSREDGCPGARGSSTRLPAWNAPAIHSRWRF
jgi:hypothetical protein